MARFIHFLCCIVFSLALLQLSGCFNFGSKARPTHYYLLTPVCGCGVNMAVPMKEFEGGLGVAVVEIPDYLRSSKLCIRVAQNEVAYAEYNRWAEPLDKGLTEILATNIQKIAGIMPPQTAPWKTSKGHDYVLRVSVEDATLNVCNCIFRVQCRFVLEHKGHNILSGAVAAEEQAVPNCYVSYASSFSKAWGQCTRSILTTIALMGKKPALIDAPSLSGLGEDGLIYKAP